MIEYWLSALTLAGIGIIMAWSFYLPVSGGLLCCGQHGFISVAAYVAGMSTLAGWPLWVSFTLGTAASTLFVFLIGIPSLRLKGLGVAIVTIGFAEIVKVFWINSSSFWPQTGGPQGLQVPEKTTTSMVIIAVIALGVLLSRLERSKLGRAIRAMHDDEVAAEAMGINLTATKLFLLAGSGFIAGIAGSLLVHHVRYISPDYFSFGMLVSLCVYAVLGGVETVWGAVIGSLVLNAILELLGFLSFMTGWRPFVYGFILVVVLMFRPAGILSREGLGRIARRAA